MFEISYNNCKENLKGAKEKMKKQKKRTKQIISFLLVVALVVGLMPGHMLTVSAEEAAVVYEGISLTDADSDGYCDINTADELYAFAGYVNEGHKDVNAELNADIDMNGKAWTPICQTLSFHASETSDTGYSGTFDGNGHTISNFTVTFNSSDTSNTYSHGLFGTVSGTVKNLGMLDVKYKNTTGDTRAGSVAGQLLTGGTITNCYSVGHSIETNNNIAGGIAGCNYGGTISNCYAYNGTVTGYSDRWGGVVGDCQKDDGTVPGTVSNCYTEYKADTRVVSSQSGNATIINCEVKETTDFASGEVTYKLNGSSSENVIWYQTIGTDAYPVFNNTHGIVYGGYDGCKLVCANSLDGLTTEPGAHTWQLDGVCSACGTECTHNWENDICKICGKSTILIVTLDSGEEFAEGEYTFVDNVHTINTDNPVTITGTTTTETVVVAAGVNAKITLNCVDIDVSSMEGKPAFMIADNSTGNVTITLADDSTNVLISGDKCAGLQKNGDYISENNGKLIIQGEELGTGFLETTGGDFGAGIGGGKQSAGSNITINGGTVIAQGGGYAAGIGGGWYAAGDNITINGGNVSATSVDTSYNYRGAGIGGGFNGAGTNITINGGTVTAKAPGVSSNSIGGGGYGSSQNLVISGGSVKALTMLGCTPTLDDKTTPVYLLEVDNTNGNTIEINDKTYPGKHGDENKVYVYLPAKSAEDTNVVKVGVCITNCYYTTEWVKIFQHSDSDNNCKCDVCNGVAHNWVNGTCSKCESSCSHQYVNAICTICGYGCANHNWEKGVCSICKTPCSHDWEDGICLICNKVCSHSWDANSNCVTCGISSADVCEHQWTNGTCSKCGVSSAESCGHSWSKGVCTKCEISSAEICKHNWIEGVCTKCEISSVEICNHSWSEGVCTNCQISSKELCNHSWDNGKCKTCGISCEHTWSNSICEVCEYKCPHGTYGNGVCTTCQTSSAELCDHNWSDGICTICQIVLRDICTHNISGGVCAICGQTTEISIAPVSGTFETGEYLFGNNVHTINTDKPVTISGTTTTETIFVADGVDANITLNGVSIKILDGNEACAFRIADNSTGNVTITLADGTTNVLQSGIRYAGLQKNGGYISENKGKLTIQGGELGTGFLEVIGGGAFSVSGGPAGIGGGDVEEGSHITINGGVVTVKSRSDGAGIGGGAEEEGSHITINGGSVTVTALGNGAGIGGGDGESGSHITINGGSVKAMSKGGNAIGGGHGHSAVIPTDKNGNDVYLLEIDNPDSKDIKINGKDYPDKHADENKIYAYLPAKSANEILIGNTATKYYYDTAKSKWIDVVDIPKADDTEFVYNGEEQTYILAESDYYTISDNLTQIIAGTYTVTVTLKDTVNTVWSDGTTEAKKYSFVINKAESKVATAPTAVTGLAYTGAAQNLVNGGTAEGGEMQYSTDNANWSSDIPTGTNAGSYSVYYKVIGDSNHNNSEPESIAVNIAKATVDIGTVTANTLTDTTDVQNVVLTHTNGTVPGALTITDSELKYGAYTYHWKFEPEDNVNYATITGTVVIKVLKTPVEENGVYQISNVGELVWFAQQINAGETALNAKLTADIDMNGVDWTIMSSFAGTFDGNGHTITGFCKDAGIADGARHGFIRTLAKGGVVKNVTFAGANVFNHEGNGAISAVIAYTNNGTVENCLVANSNIQHGDYDALGVVVGTNNGTIRNCASISNTLTRRHSSSKAVCGFVWANKGSIENCFNYDCSYQNGSNRYAFTQSNTGTITNCYYYEASETLSDVVADGEIQTKSAEAFASGEVAYLLNGTITDGIWNAGAMDGTQNWYQTLETDTYPVLDNTHGMVYYGYVNCQSQDKIYANTELSDDIPDHDWNYELDETLTNTITFSCTTNGCTKGGTVTVTAENTTYSGTDHTATVTVETEGNEELIVTPKITYTSLTEGVELVDGKPVNAGTYKASVTLGEVTAYDEFEIAKATPYIKTVVDADTITYGETLKESALSGGAVQYSETDETAIAGTWSWKEATIKPDVADSNSTLYDVVFTPTDVGNYNAVETKIILTVNKSETTPNMPESTMSALSNQQTVGGLELPEDWVWSDADVEEELILGKAVEATAIYNGADKGNYVTERVTISITRQDCQHPADKQEIRDAKEATCEEEGYTGDTYCKGCDEKIATGTKIDKSTIHTWDDGVVTKEPTATEKGEKTYTCSVCKTTKTEEMPVLDVPVDTPGTNTPEVNTPTVGTEITSEDGSATYKVTAVGENGNAVTYEAPTDKNQATVAVPATVTINNITYKVTSISDTAFAGNKKLTSVTIGDNVTGFSAKTFKGCTNLKTLNTGNGVTSIPANAFKNFKKLATVKMGTGVKTIGKNAFYGCKALKTVTIEKNVTKIGAKVFYGCTKIKTLTIKSSNLTTKNIGSKAFTKTPKSMTVKMPKKKLKTYKSMLIKKGVNKKAKFKKN